jgi:isopentenyldiphosphate isomerase
VTRPSATALVDAVDEHDQLIGTVRRREVLKVGANFRTAHVFVFDHARRLLLQRLALTRDRHPGRWGSSVAAYLFAGEDYAAAARRRAREELAVYRPLEWFGKLEMHDGPSLKFVALFTCVSDAAVINEPDHIAELRWWSLSDLERETRVHPAAFTPTFLQLLVFFRRA